MLKINKTVSTILKLLLLPCIIVGIVVWKDMYFKYVRPEAVPLSGSDPWIEYVLKGVKEELAFRYLPFILVTCVYLELKKVGNKWARMALFPLGLLILTIQVLFSTLHLPIDPIYREVFYQLPASLTFDEIIKAFLFHGVSGIAFCISYLIFIHKERPLYLIQLQCLLASSFVHIMSNLYIIHGFPFL